MFYSWELLVVLSLNFSKTTIDRKKKQIIIHFSGGCKDSYDVVY